MVSKLLLFTPKTILYNLAYKKYKHLNIKHIKHSLKLTAIFELLIKKNNRKINLFYSWLLSILPCIWYSSVYDAEADFP